MIPEDWLERARILAGAMRLAYVLTGAMTGLLPKIKLFIDGKKLVLDIPRKLSDLHGESVAKESEPACRVPWGWSPRYASDSRQSRLAANWPCDTICLLPELLCRAYRANSSRSNRSGNIYDV